MATYDLVEQQWRQFIYGRIIKPVYHGTPLLMNFPTETYEARQARRFLLNSPKQAPDEVWEEASVNTTEVATISTGDLAFPQLGIRMKVGSEVESEFNRLGFNWAQIQTEEFTKWMSKYAEYKLGYKWTGTFPANAAVNGLCEQTLNDAGVAAAGDSAELDLKAEYLQKCYVQSLAALEADGYSVSPSVGDGDPGQTIVMSPLVYIHSGNITSTTPTTTGISMLRDSIKSYGFNTRIFASHGLYGPSASEARSTGKMMTILDSTANIRIGSIRGFSVKVKRDTHDGFVEIKIMWSGSLIADYWLAVAELDDVYSTAS